MHTGDTAWYGEPEPADELSAAETAALDAVNRRVGACRSLAEALDFLYDTTRTLFPCDRIGVAFVDESGERLTAYWHRAEYEPILLKNGFHQDIGGSSLRQVVARGTPRTIDDLAVYLEQHPASPSARLLVKEGVRSSMACPLRVDDRFVGVLFRSSRLPAAYRLSHVRFQQAVAERLSQVVEKAYRIEQATEANRAYMEMLAFVSHELKNPLASIIMSGEVLAGPYLGQLNPRQQETAQRIVRESQYLTGLVRQYLDLARIDGGEIRLSFRTDLPVVPEVVDQAVELAESAIQAREMQLQRVVPDPGLRADGDPVLLRIVLVNLLSNAAKYGRSGGVIRLTVTSDGDRVRFAVWNEGEGFRAEDRGRLFRRFSRLPTPGLDEIKGTGIGLYTSWRIARLHGGHMGANSKFGQWAEFTLEIPRKAADGAARDKPMQPEPRE
jgi:signal transduction histidine kinase